MSPLPGVARRVPRCIEYRTTNDLRFWSRTEVAIECTGCCAQETCPVWTIHHGYGGCDWQGRSAASVSRSKWSQVDRRNHERSRSCEPGTCGARMSSIILPMAAKRRYRRILQKDPNPHWSLHLHHDLPRLSLRSRNLHVVTIQPSKQYLHSNQPSKS